MSERQAGERFRQAALIVVVLVHEQALDMEMADPSDELTLDAWALSGLSCALFFQGWFGTTSARYSRLRQ